MNSKSLAEGLKIFLENNPDLPDGEDIKEENNRQRENKTVELHIFVEKKGRGGKTATIIEGFDILEENEIREIAAELKKNLATGGSVRNGDILIQGDRRNDLLKILRDKGFRVK